MINNKISMSDLTNVCLYESIFELLTLRVFLIYTVLLGLEDRIQLNDGITQMRLKLDYVLQILIIDKELGIKTTKKINSTIGQSKIIVSYKLFTIINSIPLYM